ncbi:putative F-box protein At4g05475 [Eutrema salsugineum]|uniref:putative F-box protein At4g05475 n=1 Tax=Eutrema salsugineum TaxID=72664 RepID=UPI000CED397C|nr:putative F-box protein At4g05475 [Eutrema salsugineum]
MVFSYPSSSTSVSLTVKAEWLELPSELTSSILLRLDAVEILLSVQLLKTLKLNCLGYEHSPSLWDSDALVIAESMPKPRHLQLLGNKLTEHGLNAILDGFPHLQHLDIRQCFNVSLVGNLEKRCFERIKVLRRPNDSTDDYPF